MDYYLGLDLGTGSIKTVLFDVLGNEIAQSSQEYPVYQIRNGWSEQEPDDWYRAAVATVRHVMDTSGVPADSVKGIGISGQMMGAVFLDNHGVCLRRAILWNDGRTTQACEELKNLFGDELFRKYTCSPVRPGLTASKIWWVRQNEPEVFAKTAHILLPKDYLRYRLTGEFATEVSDASATQLLDVANRKWAVEILAAMELNENMLCRVYESSDITGYVLPDVAADMGISPECPVVGGASDNAAAAVGTGIVSSDQLMTTIGTSGTVFACTDSPVADPTASVYMFCMPIKDKWHFMGSVNSAGASLKWWRERFYPDDSEYVQINADAQASSPGANRLIYLPYLNGEQSPHFDLNCRGAFIGLSAIHTRSDMTRAVMEGVTYALRDIVKCIMNAGTAPNSIRMCGGGSKSPFWRQLLADICGLPVELPDMNSENSAALGAAILAAVGTGVYSDVQSACDKIIRMRSAEYMPDSQNSALYDRVYRIFDELYPHLKDSFADILNL